MLKLHGYDNAGRHWEHCLSSAEAETGSDKDARSASLSRRKPKSLLTTTSLG